MVDKAESASAHFGITIYKAASMTWPQRKQPYTDTGIRRLRCVRCGERAWSQWQVCADGNNFRAICQPCDVALNRLVLEWMGHPRAKELGDIYEGTT